MAGPIRSDGYDYDGDWKAYHDFFRKSEDELLSEEKRLLLEEAAYESHLYYEEHLIEIEREQWCEWAQANEPLDYDHDADPGRYYDIYQENCPDCFTHFDDFYPISTNSAVCECSPLYPDLRPSDLRSKSPCSCNVVVYKFLGMIICHCTSPDLYTLLERQHILLHGSKPEQRSSKSEPFNDSTDIPF